MSKQIYKKNGQKNVKKIIRFLGLGLSIIGLLFGLYIFSPIISWEIYIRPVFASSSFETPIPKNTIMTKNSLKSLLGSSVNSLSGINYDNAANWFPPSHKDSYSKQKVPTYLISIPKLKIVDAIVSTTDTDLTTHLVHYPGTAIPTNKGTGVIYGHSTMPFLYDRNNYKTIFANIHELKVGDSIITKLNGQEYTYKIFDMEITDPEDTSYLRQNYDASYLTIVTCTPPGSVAFRLIIHTRLEKS